MKLTPFIGLGWRQQRGVSLVFALLALVVVSLAAVALVRSVDTGSLVIGNLGFQVEATAASDQGAEVAIAWLQGQFGGPALDDPIPASGYYPTSLDTLDPTGVRPGLVNRAVVDWNGDACVSVNGDYTSCISPSAATTVNGITWRYVIARLCASAGDKNAIGNTCASPPAGGGSLEDPNSGSLDYANPSGFSVTTNSLYFRIIVRTVGGRNTVSHTETIVHF